MKLFESPIKSRSDFIFATSILLLFLKITGALDAIEEEFRHDQRTGELKH
jgi:hypothetical protein